MSRIFKSIFIFLITLIVPSLALAMSSTNFSVPNDVLNQTGGESTSSNYKIVHNLGESIVGYASSENYKADQGFLHPEEMGDVFISFSISSNARDFGSFSASSISKVYITLTTSTSATNGYNINAYDNTPVGIAYGMVDGSKAIADATTPNVFISLPSAGTEHYGIIVTGDNADSDYDAGTKINSLDNTTWGRIASYSSFIEDDEQTVEFRASISSITPAGNYQTITTFICTGNF